MQQHILGCWKRDFDKLLLTYSINMSLNWVYGWTRWATRWQPAKSRQVGTLPSNRIGVDSSCVFTTRTANVAKVQFWPGPGPEVMVQNRCKHYLAAVNMCAAQPLHPGIVSATLLGVKYSSSSRDKSYWSMDDWPDSAAIAQGNRLLLGMLFSFVTGTRLWLAQDSSSTYFSNAF